MKSGFGTFQADYAPALCRLCIPLLLGLAVFAGHSEALAATALSDSVGVVERFPSGSISSDELADHALSDVEAERSALERRYAAEEQECYGRFFASNCLETAKERRRASLTKLRPIEVEANTFKRRARVAERDAVLRERQASAEAAETTRRADAETKTMPTESGESVAAPSRQSEAPASTSKISASARIARHDAKLKRAQDEEAAEAKKRAESTAAFARKREESQARQRELESKKQEKVREREAKQASGAS
jgi:colicin import membrane protein